MKLRKNRRGFTIVELVIVVAVIGVLAAVLIPTFVNLTNKANKASDNSLVANLNTALAGREGETDDTANHTMQDAIDDLEVWGYKLTNLVTKSKEKLLWNEKTNRFLLEDDQLVKNSSTPEQFWQIADSIPSTQKFSLLAGNKWNGTSAEGLTVGFDIGAHKEIQTVSYIGTNKNVSFRTVGGKLNIGTSTARADGEIRSYGSADKVTVYTAKECFYSHSVISYMDLKEGKAIASTNGVIYLMEAAADTIVAEEDNGVVVIPTSATSDDIQTNVTNLPTGYSFDDDGHIVQPADIAQKVAENQGLLGSGTELDPFQIYDKVTMQAISAMYGTDHFIYKVNLERTANGTIDCSNWTPVNLYGSFDGKGVKFINLDECLFKNVKAKNDVDVIVKNFDCTFDVLTDNAGAVIGRVRHADTICNIYLSNINVHGKFISTYAASAYIGWGNGGNGNYVYNFTNCVADITLGATSNTVAGFVYHPYAKSDEYHVYNSAFIGRALVAGTWAPTQFNAQGGGTTTATYTQDFINKYSLSSLFNNAPSTAGTYTYTRYTCALTANRGSISSQNIAGTLPEVGSAFTTTKVSGATKALVTFSFGPNPGNLYSTFLSESIDLTSLNTGDSFSTSLIKYYNIAINGKEVVSGIDHGELPDGINESLNLYNLNWAGSDGTVHTADVKIVQFDTSSNALVIWSVTIPYTAQ